MKPILTAICFLLISCISFEQTDSNIRALEKRVDSLYNAGNHDSALLKVKSGFYGLLIPVAPKEQLHPIFGVSLLSPIYQTNRVPGFYCCLNKTYSNPAFYNTTKSAFLNSGKYNFSKGFNSINKKTFADDLLEMGASITKGIISDRLVH